MSMFDTYDKLNPDYIPDNSTPTPTEEYLTINKVLPRPLYDVRNRFIGYNWNHGEYFDFTLSVNSMITVNNDSLIFEEKEAAPDTYTVGKYEGQKAYNVVDAKSWTYVGRTDSLYIWVEDTELSYPINGDKSIIIYRDMTDKYILVNIFNFRWEQVYCQQSEVNESSIRLTVDDELSKKLVSGIYYCTVKICSEDSCLLKDKFMISIN